MTILRRELEAGETLSFDNGRVVITMEEKSGRKARLKIQISADIAVDKPRMAVNGIFPLKALATAKNVQ